MMPRCLRRKHSARWKQSFIHKAVSQVTYAAKRRASNALRTAGGTRWALSRWGNAWIHEFDAVIRNQATRQADICRGCPFAK